MQKEPVSGPPSTEITSWTWIMIAILLVLAVAIGAGSLALTYWNQQAETPTGSQSVPTRR